jgi:hypothetical protein
MGNQRAFARNKVARDLSSHHLYIRRIFEPFLCVQCLRLNKPLRSVGRTGFLEAMGIADVPDLGFRNHRFQTFLFVSKNNRFTRGKTRFFMISVAFATGDVDLLF